jgi:poly(3-hydroxybutyrate) depolymerase
MRCISVSLVAAVLLVVAALIAAVQGEPAQRAPVEHVYAQPSGTQLKAYVFSPDKRAAERRPAIVPFHGST